jgi:hypothetical protein
MHLVCPSAHNSLFFALLVLNLRSTQSHIELQPLDHQLALPTHQFTPAGRLVTLAMHHLDYTFTLRDPLKQRNHCNKIRGNRHWLRDIYV